MPQKLGAWLTGSDVWALVVHSQNLEPFGLLFKATALIACSHEGPAAGPAHFLAFHRRCLGAQAQYLTEWGPFLLL